MYVLSDDIIPPYPIDNVIDRVKLLIYLRTDATATGRVEMEFL